MSKEILEATHKTRSRVSHWLAWACFTLVLGYSAVATNRQGTVIEKQVITIASQQMLINQQSEQLQSRKRWMVELSEWIEETTADRWTHDNTVEAWRELFDANPSLVVPDEFLPFHYEPPKPELPELPK